MAVQSARESARRVQCVSNLRQIGLALQNYASREGVFPSAMPKSVPNQAFCDFAPFVRILPELEQTPLFHSINFSAHQPPRGVGPRTRLPPPTPYRSSSVRPMVGAGSLARA